MTTQNQRLKEVLSDKPSAVWQEETKKRRQAQPAHDRAFEIALSVMDALEDKGWSQTQLAAEMGITRQAVSKTLQGNCPISMPTIEKLETALGARISEVAHRTES